MTQRKPPNMSFPDWVERQILTAQAQGAFDNLPGAGKPIPGLDRPWHELSWIANYLRRENVDVAALLPPALALAKEIEVLEERLLKERSVSRVRDIVEDLNDRIREAHQRPQSGPPIRVHALNVDDVVERWTCARAAEDAALAASAETSGQTRPTPRRSRFRRRPR
jgi:hypothetical protein